MFHTYLNSSSQTIADDASCILMSSIQQKKPPQHAMKRICKLVKDSHTDEAFRNFVEELCKTDQTWKFWAQFVFRDCFCYFSLYLAVRSSNWRLRVVSLKQMAPVFTAFDRDFYARILPHHLAEIQSYPSLVLTSLEKGGFTVNLTGQRWRAVALDEPHEMCINKDLKTAVARPTETYLQKTSLFFNHRIKLHKNLVQQLFPEREASRMQSIDTLDNSPQAHQYKENVKQICDLIGLFPNNLENNRGLFNIFTSQLANHEQTNDMLSFYQIGETAYQNYVRYHTHASNFKRESTYTTPQTDNHGHH